MLISTTKKFTAEKKFKNAPAGLHLARLYKVVDIGSQHGEWQGKATFNRKIVFYFELHGDDATGQPLVNDDGKPLIITKYYNVSLGEKATLRRHLQSWLNLDFNSMPGGFKVESILGNFAMINVITYQKDGETKTTIDNLTAVPAIIVKHGLPKGVNDLFIFDLNKFDNAKFDLLSDNVKKIIMESPEYRALTQPSQPIAADDDFDQDIPF